MLNVKQAGGHQLIKGDGKHIYKPTKLTEVIFYTKYLPKYPELAPFVPKVSGSGKTKDIKENFDDDQYKLIIEKCYNGYVKLENLMYHLRDDDYVLIDIKVGSILWCSDATKEKIQHTKDKNKTSTVPKYKFRIDGMISKDLMIDKISGRQLKINQVMDIFSRINAGAKTKIINWIDSAIPVLKEIPINFYGLSLFMVINGDEVVVKFIDFVKYEEIRGKRLDDLVESLESVKSILNQSK